MPEDLYETIRRRARRAGQMIQAFVLARTVEIVRRPTPDDVLADIDADLAERPRLAVDIHSLLGDRDNGRP